MKEDVVKLYEELENTTTRKKQQEEISLLKVQNSRWERAISDQAKRNHQTAVEAKDGVRAQNAIILDFAVGGMGALLSDDLGTRPGMKLGTSEMFHRELLVAIRTSESKLNPVFIHLPFKSLAGDLDEILQKLVVQLDAISKARVTVSQDTLQWYRQNTY